MSQLSPFMNKLISSYDDWYKFSQTKEKKSAIHVDEVASRVAAFYEKIRGIIDWKEEHLLKRGAIERILKRKFFSKVDLTNGNLNAQGIAETLVLELIRGGHFPNDRIEELKIQEVQRAIDKYAFILNNAPIQEKKPKIQLYNWISSIAACEIEEILLPYIKERELINFMFELMKQRIELDKPIDEKEKNTQIYIAVQRALFNLDAPVISYHLLKYRYSEWKKLDPKQLREISQSIYLIWEKLEQDLNHRLGDKFYQICEKYDTPYLLLGDILSENPVEVKRKIINPEVLEELIKQAYQKRLKTLKSRLTRAAFYATLSIFLTNIVSLLAIEIPFTRYVTGNFNFLAIGIDILVPTFLMFLLVATIKPPPKGNLERVIMETMKIAYHQQTKDIYKIKSYKKRGIIFDTVINTLYFLFFCLLVGLTVWGLYYVNFPILSYFIFIIFLSLIAFAGAKIRQRAKELHIIESRETFFHFILDPFAVPIVQLGKWLTGHWRKYNVISAFFSALIDMPFLLFVEFIEQWRYFLKEKKEKIH